MPPQRASLGTLLGSAIGLPDPLGWVLSAGQRGPGVTLWVTLP